MERFGNLNEPNKKIFSGEKSMEILKRRKH
jgi:hypothetical protein